MRDRKAESKNSVFYLTAKDKGIESFHVLILYIEPIIIIRIHRIIFRQIRFGRNGINVGGVTNVTRDGRDAGEAVHDRPPELPPTFPARDGQDDITPAKGRECKDETYPLVSMNFALSIIIGVMDGFLL